MKTDWKKELKDLLLVLQLGDGCMGVHYTILFTFVMFDNIQNKKFNLYLEAGITANQ